MNFASAVLSCCRKRHFAVSRASSYFDWTVWHVESLKLLWFHADQILRFGGQQLPFDVFGIRAKASLHEREKRSIVTCKILRYARNKTKRAKSKVDNGGYLLLYVLHICTVFKKIRCKLSLSICNLIHFLPHMVNSNNN